MLDLSPLDKLFNKPVDHKEPIKNKELQEIINKSVTRDKEQDKALNDFKEYNKIQQENIRKAQHQQSKLLYEIKAGKPKGYLLLEACKIIRDMTGNTLFYNEVESNLRSVLGRGLYDAEMLEMEIRELTERKERLKHSYQIETDPETKSRISRAIETHKNEIKRLEAMENNKKAVSQ